MSEDSKILEDMGDYKYGFHDRDDNYAFKSRKGLDRDIVEQISRMKDEPQWMLDFRLKALDHFIKRPMPNWGPALKDLNLDDIYYYVKPTEKQEKSWDDVPDDIKRTFDKLGVPEAERKFLAGLGAQYECLSGDTRVYAARGVVPIRSILPGDVVFAFDEVTNEIIPAPVKNFMPKGKRPVYEVKIGTRTIRATENHPFLVLVHHKKEGYPRGHHSHSWKYLRDLRPGDLVAAAKSLPDVGQDYLLEQSDVELPEQTSLDLLWRLGLYEVAGFVHHEDATARVETPLPATGGILRKNFKPDTSDLFAAEFQTGDSYCMTIEASPRDHAGGCIGYVKIDSITPAGVEEVFDIEVDGPHNFVAEGLIVHNSEMVYHSIQEHLEKQGVIFLSIEDGLRKHPDLFREYFGTIVPIDDNKFAALNSAVWSGGSFVYVPKGVKVDLPLQAYFRLNTANVGQFERTLIIVDEGASVHYVEGCFLEGARVRTRNGEKGIEDVQVGDEVMTHQGRWRNVYHTQKRPYHGKVYGICYYGDSRRELKVTAEHPLLVLRRERVQRQDKDILLTWSRADSLREGDCLAIPVPRLEPDFELTAASGAKWSHPSPGHEIRLKEFIAMSVPDWAAENPEGDLTHSPFVMDENFLYVPIREITVEEDETEVYNFSVEEDESYVAEGVVSHNCTAPQYTTDSFHSGVIEIIVKRGARSRYSTIQNWSHNVYNLVTQRAKVYGEGTHEWVDANLGCLAEGSTVTTPQGIKAIEDVQVGEQVLSYDEGTGALCFRTVTAKRFSGYQPVHTVSAGERKLTVTSNHPFYSYRYAPDNAKKSGRYQFGYVRADQLQEAIVPRTSLDYGIPHYLTMPELDTGFQSLNHYRNNPTMTSHRPARLMLGEYTTDDVMWLFGYGVGDGNLDIIPAKTEGVIRFARTGYSTPAEDRAHGKLVDVMTSTVDVEPGERADGYHLSRSGSEMAEFFRANGFFGIASEKRVPQWVWSLPESQRLAFIAGFIDAGGHVNLQGFQIKSAHRSLLEDMASLLVTLGITSRVYTEFNEPRRLKVMGVEVIAHGAHRLAILPDARLLALISPRLQEEALKEHSRKHPMRRQTGRPQLIQGADVEIVAVNVSPATQEKIPTWDIEVDGTGNFVSQGFIVHNSKITMKYPSCYLMEPGARGEMLSMAFAGAGQIQDAGSKMVHFAPNTSSKITSKSISKNGGRASYRGLLKVYKGAKGVKSNVVCDALLLDPQSRSDTYPYIEIDEDDVTIGHEASVSKVGEEQLFYLMSRGLSEEEATTMVVSGFIEPLVKELPMEYAVEMNRLIALQMEGSIG